MDDLVRNLEVEVLATGWRTLRRNSFDFRRRDGQWQRLTRETYDLGDAAAVLLLDPARDTVILVRQFRFPVYAAGDPPLLIEVCAGLLDDDDPETCDRREAEEETGYRVGTLKRLCVADMCPGSVQHRIHLFLGSYTATDRSGAGGGLADEGEDIEVIELPLDDALALIASGGIVDAKTIMLLLAARDPRYAL